jgi:hypothetical protein
VFYKNTDLQTLFTAPAAKFILLAITIGRHTLFLCGACSPNSYYIAFGNFIFVICDTIQTAKLKI